MRGEPFPHLLFHYRLAWSGWAYGQVIHGGESFVALSEGLQNALAACGGVPRELRTDRLSAASRNRDGSYALDITPRYQALCAHYGLSPSRNNRGVAHENGIVEAPHGHVKRRLEQKLLLRGSCNFDEPAEYGELLAEVFSALTPPGSGATSRNSSISVLWRPSVLRTTSCSTFGCAAPARSRCGR
ncbi:hypothetical protein [Cyanobium sp. LEGE 06113]|uniref:hypothetical protein n=1 Tax=Cyanobium sp. LEGE 06113 TaxID=1297573 RepID=UPI001D15DA91|nr:hypothetical protein [Cyanobium sp. LEGE 06113]